MSQSLHEKEFCGWAGILLNDGLTRKIQKFTFNHMLVV